MQPVLHAQIAAEENRFDIVGVLQAISDKLVRRHPHVFGAVTVENSAEVLVNWEAIKRAEKAQKSEVQKVGKTASSTSVLDDVPQTLPALLLALQVSKKAARAGFEWPDIGAVMDKLREEMDELDATLDDSQATHASQEQSQERVADELGDLLFTAVNVARWKGINPELALRDMVRRFCTRFGEMERLAGERSLDLESLTLAQWDALWGEAKVIVGGQQ